MRLLSIMLAIACAANDANAAPRPMKGSELAIRWPELIGETIQVRVTPKQALDTVRYRVMVDKTDAVMLIGPGKVWTGTKTVCATVTGGERYSKQGRTQVVGLMLAECP